MMWFATVPGVAETGAFNAHFVRDIGAAYALCGLAFLVLAGHAAARPYAISAVLFLGAHAAIHVGESVAGVHTLGHLLADLPAVVLLPLAAAWAAFRRTR
jgi:hypothetical protein